MYSAGLIFKAMEFYRSRGFHFCDVPAGRVTSPLYFDFVHEATHRFIELWDKGLLPNTVESFQSLTPVEDSIYLCLGSPVSGSHEYMMQSSAAFFKVQGLPTQVCKESEHWKTLHTENGVILGSYGVIEKAGVKWNFGTGLAEPAFSKTYREVQSARFFA